MPIKYSENNQNVKWVTQKMALFYKLQAMQQRHQGIVEFLGVTTPDARPDLIHGLL